MTQFMSNENEDGRRILYLYFRITILACKIEISKLKDECIFWGKKGKEEKRMIVPLKDIQRHSRLFI